MNPIVSNAMRLQRSCALAVWVTLAAQASTAAAEPASPPGSGPRTGPPALLALVLKSDSLLLSADDLAEALSRELGVVVLPLGVLGARRSTGVITVSWRRTRAELAVSYDEPGRGVVSRVVRAPGDAPAAGALAVTLAGNLARDQVADFLGAPTAPEPVIAGLDPAPPEPPPVPAPILRVSPYQQPEPTGSAPARRARSPITLALFHPLATNGDQPGVSTWFHLNLIYGRVGELNGFALGGWNIVDGPVRGVAVGMLGNRAASVAGAQLGLLGSLTTDDLVGLQGALGFNSIGGDLRGVQATFGVNHTAGAVNGLQAGVVNVAEGPVRGVQIGLVNLSERQVSGLQVGLVNLADDMRGLPLGLVNLSRTGSVAPVLWVSTATVANLGVKFISRNSYTILGMAMDIKYPAPSSGRDKLHFVGPGLTIGARFLTGETVTISSDVGAGLLSSAPDCCRRISELWLNYEVLPRWRVSLELNRFPGLLPFLGGGIAVKIHREYGRTESTDAVPEAFVGVAL